MRRDDLERRRRTLRRVANSSAVFTVAISVAVLLLWTSRLSAADMALPFLFEMKVNTALGFAAAGIALYLLERDRPRAAARFALVPVAIGLVTLAEYLWRLSIPFDQLLIRDWSSQAELMPGRPSSNSALALAGIGAATIALVRARPWPARRVVVKFICFTVIAIGMVAIAGYIANSPFAVGWGTLRKMALPTAACTIAMGTGLMAYSWQAETAAIARIPIWIPALIAFAVVLLDVSTPLEINAGICYVPLVFCALWFERPHVAIVLAAISTLLIMFGFLASPRGILPLWAVEVNRSLDVLAVWVVGLLVYLQRRAARNLERNARHLAAAQELAQVGSFELDPGRMTFKPSPQFEAMHGLAPASERDWTEFARAALPPDDRAAVEALLAAAGRGEKTRDLDYGFVRADGAARNAIMHCEMSANGGSGQTLIGVVREVTELRQAEARHADIESQLRHAQKMEALGVVAGSVAHDLNNTLMPITTLVPFMIEDAGDGEHKRSLEIIMRSGRRARELVREILIFSRKEEAAQEPLRLDLLARDTLTILRAGIPTSIAIVDALEPVPEILGARGQLYQTILNLATNAAQAIGEDGGTITIIVRPQEGGPRPSVHLSVADDGAGMNEATRARIFEPFFSTKAESAGTGLGLAIVSGIVARHGGTIAVESAPGRGTRFDLVFPAANGESAREAA